jgi:hypothetical protein
VLRIEINAGRVSFCKPRVWTIWPRMAAELDALEAEEKKLGGGRKLS